MSGYSSWQLFGLNNARKAFDCSYAGLRRPIGNTWLFNLLIVKNRSRENKNNTFINKKQIINFTVAMFRSSQSI